jgi:hypothetical protein
VYRYLEFRLYSIVNRALLEAGEDGAQLLFNPPGSHLLRTKNELKRTDSIPRLTMAMATANKKLVVVLGATGAQVHPLLFRPHPPTPPPLTNTT